MKKVLISILCLALTSLACLESAALAQGSATATAAPTIETLEEAAGAVYEMPVITVAEPALTKVSTASVDQQICARVVAIEALHVRAGASETGRILAWLKNNDVVFVVDEVDPNWWHIESGVYDGYARSIYLQESECE